MKNLISFALLLGFLFPAHVLSEQAAECVVVLHGMGRTHQSMGKIQDQLGLEGYQVVNESYASTSASIQSLAESAVGGSVRKCQALQASKIHFVTHSLGGILVRVYLQENNSKDLGKIVMLAPPNKGSEIAEILKEYSAYKMAMGPAGQALGTTQESLPNQLDPIAGDIGIIAGNATSDPWFSPFIPGEDDGKVSVESAKLDEMKDFIVMDSGHTFIMRNDIVIAQIVHFLQKGVFKHQE